MAEFSWPRIAERFIAVVCLVSLSKCTGNVWHKISTLEREILTTDSFVFCSHLWMALVRIAIQWENITSTYLNTVETLSTDSSNKWTSFISGQFSRNEYFTCVFFTKHIQIGGSFPDWKRTLLSYISNLDNRTTELEVLKIGYIKMNFMYSLIRDGSFTCIYFNHRFFWLKESLFPLPLFQIRPR